VRNASQNKTVVCISEGRSPSGGVSTVNGDTDGLSLITRVRLQLGAALPNISKRRVCEMMAESRLYRSRQKILFALECALFPSSRGLCISRNALFVTASSQSDQLRIGEVCRLPASAGSGLVFGRSSSGRGSVGTSQRSARVERPNMSKMISRSCCSGSPGAGRHR
jgi:hypothetical protein